MNGQTRLREVLQQILDGEADGWILNHYLIVMGLQKIGPDGQVETTAWVTSPNDQADYVTDGLLAAAVDMREGCIIDDD